MIITCFAGEWNPDGEDCYIGDDLRFPKGKRELHCDEFETLIPDCRGSGMNLHNEFDEIFFVPHGDDPTNGGYFCTPDELLVCQ